jgi:hypothetical protein
MSRACIFLLCESKREDGVRAGRLCIHLRLVGSPKSRSLANETATDISDRSASISRILTS